MTNDPTKAYPRAMTSTPERAANKVCASVTAAVLADVPEAEINRQVAAGIETARSILAARQPIDWGNIPTLGSVLASS